MTYVEGFLTPVPTANKDAYKKHAAEAVELFKRLGATRFVEAWGDDVPDGKLNDLKKAVQLKDDETVLFSWVEYPDKAARDAANEKMASEFDPSKMGDMPFDAKRMIFAGFDPLLEKSFGGDTGYVDGYVLAVPEGNRDRYKAMAERTTAIFQEHGATRVVEGWGEDIPDGKLTDYNKATLRKDGERVVYSWVEWPSREARDAAWPKIMQDSRMMDDSDKDIFDGQRMMWGGFQPILDEA